MMGHSRQTHIHTKIEFGDISSLKFLVYQGTEIITETILSYFPCDRSERHEFESRLLQKNTKRTLVNSYKDIVLVTILRNFCTTLFTNNNIIVVTQIHAFQFDLPLLYAQIREGQSA